MAVLHEDPQGFTLAQREKLIKLIAERTGDAHCEMCGHDKWALNPRPTSALFLVNADTANDMGADLGTAHPSALIHCMNCGNSKLFSLSILKFDLTFEANK